jgi:hypothetical protein
VLAVLLLLSYLLLHACIPAIVAVMLWMSSVLMLIAGVTATASVTAIACISAVADIAVLTGAP